MSTKELQRKEILDQLCLGQMNLRAASERMGISYRQAKRLARRYREASNAGLVHRSRGRVSNHRTPIEQKEKILAAYCKHYMNFGPTFASEKLEEREGIKINRETLRRLLKAEGLWSLHRRRSPYRQRREPRAEFGALLQLDGSHHAWFHGNPKKCCLMNLIDDATNIGEALLDEEETTRAAFLVLKRWIERFGIPEAIYVDAKSVYVSPRGRAGFTHFARACNELGIRVIIAHSPQAKGRIERRHAVFQDRFVKELYLERIDTLEEANRYLQERFLPDLNQRLSHKPSSDQDKHVPLREGQSLDNILCWYYVRKLQRDFTISWSNRVFQLDRASSKECQPRCEIEVRKSLTGEITLWFKGRQLQYQECTVRPSSPSRVKEKPTSKEEDQSPKTPSPWRQFNPGWLSR